MTDNVRGSLGPPWSVDLLADLHAGVLDLDESERLWPQVNADQEARAIIEALDSVMGDLGDLSTAPVEPMPARFAASLDTALAAEARSHFTTAAAPVAAAPRTPPPAPVIDLAAARKRRNRLAAWGAGVLTAAAAAVAVAVVAVPSNSTDGSGVAGDAPKTTQQDNSEGAAAGPPVALSSDNLNQAIGLLNGKQDYGDLDDEQGLRTCLDENEIPSADMVAVSPVTFDGQEAVGALFGASEPGQPGKFRLVVLTKDCEVLAQSTLPS